MLNLGLQMQFWVHNMAAGIGYTGTFGDIIAGVGQGVFGYIRRLVDYGGATSTSIRKV